jgi:hypothetical protein
MHWCGPKSCAWCRSGPAVFLSCFVILSQAVYAAAIKVEGDAPLKSVAVTIENATLSNVVIGLSNKYGFEVKGLEMLNDSQPFSAHPIHCSKSLPLVSLLSFIAPANAN